MVVHMNTTNQDPTVRSRRPPPSSAHAVPPKKRTRTEAKSKEGRLVSMRYTQSRLDAGVPDVPITIRSGTMAELFHASVSGRDGFVLLGTADPGAWFLGINAELREAGIRVKFSDPYTIVTEDDRIDTVLPYHRLWVGNDVRIGIWRSKSVHADRIVWLSQYARRATTAAASKDVCAFNKE